MLPRPDIEADWTLLHTCNFRCGYCFYGPHELGRKLVVHASPEDWARAFDRTGLAWRLHITGGEPTIYPGFAALCVALARRHTLSLNTNLAGRAVARFAAEVPADRVAFINAGLHVDERAKHAALEEFCARVHLLRHAGFPVMVTAVMTRAMIAAWHEVRATLSRLGVAPVPKVMRGWYAGSRWPDAYSDEERAAIRGFLDDAAPEIERLHGNGDGRITIDARVDRKLVSPEPGRDPTDYRGRLCAAGTTFVAIAPDGALSRCSTDTPLGNLLAGTARLMAGPTPCDTSHCPYFCEKYTGRDEIVGALAAQAARRRAGALIPPP